MLLNSLEKEEGKDGDLWEKSYQAQMNGKLRKW